MKSIYDYGFSKELYKLDTGTTTDYSASEAIGTGGEGDVYNSITGTTNASLITGGNLAGNQYIRITAKSIIMKDDDSDDRLLIGDDGT
jgi:hypothetical protein